MKIKIEQIGGGAHRYASQNLTKEEREELNQMSRLARRIAMSHARRSGESEPKSAQDRDADIARFGSAMRKRIPNFWDSNAMLQGMFDRAESIGEANVSMLHAMHYDDTAMCSTMFGMAWADGAFPFVRIPNANLAEFLMQMTTHPSMATLIEPPWKAFRIGIPSGVLTIDFGTGGASEAVSRISVMRNPLRDQTWTLVVEGSTVMMHVADFDTSDLCEDIVDDLNIESDADWALGTRDRRCLRLVCRLVLGISMSFDKAAGASCKRRVRDKHRGSRETKDPVIREYVFTRPVSVDLRGCAREYIQNGGRGAPKSVQTLVRGYWRHQPCGPGSKDRKFIHIDPHWRGPEDAPIAVRPHVLQRSADAA